MSNIDSKILQKNCKADAYWRIHSGGFAGKRLPIGDDDEGNDGDDLQGKARQGKARQGKARQGKARQGKARQGKRLVGDNIILVEEKNGSTMCQHSQ